MLIYENTEDLNALGGHCHHMMVKGFWYTLGEGLSEEMRVEDCPNADVWFVAYANHESTHKRGA